MPPVERLKTPTAPVIIWPLARDTQPAEVSTLYKAGEAPTIAIIADTGEASAGPLGWMASAKILLWARAIEIQADDLPADTSTAVKATAKYRRILLIRTRFQHVTTWRLAAEFSGCRRFLPLSPDVAKPSNRRGA